MENIDKNKNMRFNGTQQVQKIYEETKAMYNEINSKIEEVNSFFLLIFKHNKKIKLKR